MYIMWGYIVYTTCTIFHRCLFYLQHLQASSEEVFFSYYNCVTTITTTMPILPKLAIQDLVFAHYMNFQIILLYVSGDGEGFGPYVCLVSFYSLDWLWLVHSSGLDHRCLSCVVWRALVCCLLCVFGFPV